MSGWAERPVTPAARRWLVVVGVVLLVVFTALLLQRTAFRRVPMTDIGVYLVAGDAVNTGADIYSVRDSRGWSYHYPPLLAIVVSPLGTPKLSNMHPPGGPKLSDGAVRPLSAENWKYAVAVVLFTWVSVLCLAWSVRSLARLLWKRPVVTWGDMMTQWLFPLALVAGSSGTVLSRSQVELFILALLVGYLVNQARRRGVIGGFLLAIPACIKIIPAFLFLKPAWRRRPAVLTGVALGLVFGLLAVPAMVLGWDRTIGYMQAQANRVLLPALGMGDAGEKEAELLGMQSTSNQSLVAVLHSLQNLGTPRDQRPVEPTKLTRYASYAIALAMLGVTLMAARWRGRESAHAAVLLLGCLAVIMIIVSPVAHTHYFCLLLPLIMGVMAHAWTEPAKRLMAALLVFYLLADLLVVIPRAHLMAKDLGVQLLAVLLLWTAGVVALRRHTAPLASGEQSS